MEPIAIVGMAMKFPGDSISSESFWEMLQNGRSAHSPIPKERFDGDGFYHPDSARAGSINVKGGYFLSESCYAFDAPFFSMTAHEANGTDPQQRMILEVAYQALENAGIPLPSVAGSRTGVYVGCFTDDWLSVSSRDPYSNPFYAATGNGLSMLSNRLSWFFDLRGPSMTINTACSSSLYAVHLACQSLKLKESKMAIVGGTNMIADPSYMRDMCAMTLLSPDGVCHSFDHRANGYARGDGVAAIILKTVKQAIEDGDTIRAIIRGSGLNQDGKTPGITMPSPQAQADLILSTYEAAGLSLHDTMYFEAHGTGTALGDPYELSAIGQTFGANRELPLYVGSVKTNIGHLEGCAGLAGLIKTVLIVENGEIPPLVGFERANPRFHLDDWRIRLCEDHIKWPTEGLRRASVNSFGYGGANAHVIVEDAYHHLEHHGLAGNHQTRIAKRTLTGCNSYGVDVHSVTNGTQEAPFNPYKIFPFSAADLKGLQRISVAMSLFFERQMCKDDQDKPWLRSKEYFNNFSYTLTSRRTMLDYRSFVVAQSIEDLVKEFKHSGPKCTRTARTNNIVFTFTGQGAQWPTMGEGLMSIPVYRQSVATSQEILTNLGCQWSVAEEISATGTASRIDSPELSQPLCTVLQIALVDLLAFWNIKPKSVVGHSSGEIAAAYATGYISREDAVRIAFLRGVYSADVSRRHGGRKGAMMAVGLSHKDVEPYLIDLPGQSVVVACINAPSSVTLSGDEYLIDALVKTLAAQNIFARRLRVQIAYHSPHMAVIADDYEKSIGSLQSLTMENSGVTMFSSVTGLPVTSAADLDARYWVQNMLNTVRFAEATHALFTSPSNPKSRRKTPVSYAAIIEIGPADALHRPLAQIIAAADERLSTSVTYTSVLARQVDARVSALQAVGKLWGHGLSINIDAINFPSLTTDDHGQADRRQLLADLPPYPFNHEKIYLHESAWGKIFRHRSKPRTDLLGMTITTANPNEHRWTNYIRTSEQPWITDHKVQNVVLYPGAGMIVMAIEAAKELVDHETSFHGLEARNVIFKRGMVMPDGGAPLETAIHLQVKHSSEIETEYEFLVFSQITGQPWVENCSGSIAVCHKLESSHCDLRTPLSKINNEQFLGIKKRSTKNIPPLKFYRLCDKKMNLQYGPLFQNVTECLAGIGEGYGSITIPDTRAIMPSQFEYPHTVHPTTLDTILHLQIAGLFHSFEGNESLVPTSIESIYIAADLEVAAQSTLRVFFTSKISEQGEAVGDIFVGSDDSQTPKVIVRGFLLKNMANPNSSTIEKPHKCTVLEWREMENADPPEKLTNGHKSEPTREIPVAQKKIIVLINNHVSNEAEALAKRLHEIAGDAEQTTISFTDVSASTVSGKTVISLLEVDSPFTSRWTVDEMARFQTLVTEASSLIWISRAAGNQVTADIDISMSNGLLRTIRVEIPQLLVSQLHLSSGCDIISDGTIELIRRVLDNTVSEATDHEFLERDGTLYVPRLVTDQGFHQELGLNVRTPNICQLDPDGTYVLAGGLGGIGRSIANMMFEAGARNILFISRSGARSEDAQKLLLSLEERGCVAEAYCCDICDPDQVKSFVDSCLLRGQKIKGIVHCAMVLRDSTFNNMSHDQWTEATRPKTHGSWNLHEYMPKDVDFFIMLSSMAGVIGHPGQANYNAANTYQDALSTYRRSQGLASMAIDLGVVDDVGYVAENAEQYQRLEYLENLFISERDLHRILSAAMRGETRDGTPVPAQLVTGVGEDMLAHGSIGTAMRSDLKYQDMHRSVDKALAIENTSEEDEAREKLTRAETPREAARIVEDIISHELAKTLAVQKEDIDMAKPMHTYGVDSLTAVEIRNMVFRKSSADLSVFEILSETPLGQLVSKIVGKSKLIKSEVALAIQADGIEEDY
ncbi:Hypothetical protein R9X50_00536000 [Acrodontium crateriforme]|uniref:Polyketide synthase n=1 Tax=Acrodontium crateriforme TaxID=150365 RepID=A0AAQ3M7T3_9PEZI|nr:Hypothetical protein R9X50_00536000 [Acrodontium crateriforme]